jgi:hypothetical protein
MCCEGKQGHQSVIVTQGVCQSDAREMCGCEIKHGHHAMPMRHKIHHSDAHGTCGCGERKLLSKKERIDMLEEYRESLECELDGVEEKLKEINGES